jgi:hypothetical protein
MPIMLLRNLNPALGLANGTRLIVTRVGRRLIQAKIMTGHEAHVGKEVLIPRINFTSSENDLPFKLYRWDFQVIAAAWQGMGFDIKQCGCDLSMPCYVAAGASSLFVQPLQ